ncbi:hypothetical protein [Vagococcus fluvialis]|uniref:hypothetical protein n=1 Tax=Vagococcus fluvialis TaxID=2738 RepID=UPI001D0B6177|nr:hypothetical protein [Vagococcus fluvialis]UDM84079.1 hypothetical protein K5K96_15310 [Vagococcus fluvialis]
MLKNSNKRAASISEFQNIVLTTKTDNIISKKIIDNVTLSNSRYFLDGLIKSNQVESFNSLGTKGIIIKNSKKNGINLESTVSDLYDLEKQSNLSLGLDDLGFQIESVNLLEFDRRKGNILNEYDKDMQLSKNFVVSVFKEVPLNSLDKAKGKYFKLNLRYQTLSINQLNPVKSNSKFLDIFTINSSDLSLIQDMLNEKELVIPNFSMIYIANLNKWLYVINNSLKPLDLDEYIDLMLEHKEKYKFISFSHRIELLNKQYVERELNIKKYTNNKNKRERGNYHG